ncbi:hypothetical protein C8J48_3170 [Desmospora activa DSM 45169]|uniref:Uncharacterized protein n=1 Tax=Desmospora activa DSM 45169 TaxID=1121389 RepID=A0A2T4Z4R4_9BACL|nr:hypothetical protein C8J48_3170 [Desmospora activa DSM 45169]
MWDLLSRLFRHLWQGFLVFGPVMLAHWLQNRQRRKKSDTRRHGDQTSKH